VNNQLLLFWFSWRYFVVIIKKDIVQNLLMFKIEES